MKFNFYKKVLNFRTIAGKHREAPLNEIPEIIPTAFADQAVAIRYVAAQGSMHKLFDARFVRISTLYGLNNTVESSGLPGQTARQTLRIFVKRDGETFSVCLENISPESQIEFKNNDGFHSSREANEHASEIINRLLGTRQAVGTNVHRSYKTVLWVFAAFLIGGFVFSKGTPGNAAAPVKAQIAHQEETPKNILDYRAGQRMENGELKLSEPQLKDLLSIESKVGFPLRPVNPDGTPFYVFADPNCPHCKNLEKELEKLDDKWNPIIIPVGILGENSSNLVASIESAESPDAAAVEWKNAIEGRATTSLQTYAGQQKARVSQAFFTLLGLPGTPALISADGRVIAQEISSKYLSQWLGAIKK